jgi:DNA-binding beta-propeller fold protein YncE
MKINPSRILLLAATLSAPISARAADVSTQALATAALATQGPDIVFPKPPDKPRIRFVRSIQNVDDLRGKKKKKVGFLDRLIAFFSGGEKIVEMFNNPYGIWRHGDKIYVSDTGAQHLVVVDLKAATFSYLGERGEESLKSPVGVSVDEADNVYVTDTGDSSVKAYGPDGKLMWKSEGGGGEAGKLNRPAGIALTPAGELLVADSSNRRIVVLSKTGQFLREMCLHAKKEYYALPNPNNVWSLKNGEFLVSDPLAARVHIFSSTGAATGGFGEPGDSAGYLSRPRGVAADSDGHIHVVDALFSRVQVFNRNGEILVWYGGPGSQPGDLALPAGIFIDANDMIYISNSKGRRIDIFQYISYPEEKEAADQHGAK